MPWIAQDSQSVGRLAGGPGSVPEDAGEAEGHLAAGIPVHPGGGNGEQHPFATVEQVYHTVVKLVDHLYVRGNLRVCVFGINPEIPIVFKMGALQAGH
jgi:hypothetical protein